MFDFLCGSGDYLDLRKVLDPSAVPDFSKMSRQEAELWVRGGGREGEGKGGEREGRVRASRGTHTHRLTIASFHDLPHLIGHQVSTVSWHHLIVRSSVVMEVGGADLREALVRREVGRTCSEERSS